MKTMKCSQLGGACDLEFTGNTFEEIAEQSKKHGMDMFQKGDEAHLEAMNKLREVFQDPNSTNDWMKNKKVEFEALPNNK